MDWIWLIVVLVSVFLLVKFMSRASSRDKRRRLYAQRGALFTPAERSFLGVLDQATTERYRVFGKVRIADVLQPVAGLDRSLRTATLNRISAKHFDFVICDPATIEIKAVIELNDKSHARKRRAKRDELVALACSDAGLILKNVKAQRSYSLEAVKRIVDEIDSELSTGLVQTNENA